MNFSNMGAINFAGSTVFWDWRDMICISDETAMQRGGQSNGQLEGLVIIHRSEFQLCHFS